MIAPDYDFKSLSPYDFEILARDLLSVHDGVTYSTYRVGADGGIDLQAVPTSGRIIAQCKHTPEATRSTLVRLAKSELNKAHRLEPPPAQYYFVTSADISVKAEREIQAIFLDAGLPAQVRGRGWLNSVLAQNQHLEQRHFKLWLVSTKALRRMMQGGIFLRGESRIRRIERNYRRFVHHETCTEAEKVLDTTGCVLLSGAPGSGKTTIAEYLLLIWSRRNYRIVVDPRSVDRWWEWLEDDIPTVFFFDDAWGVTRFHDHGNPHHDSDLSEFIESLVEKNENGSHSKLIIMTSRTQVLLNVSLLSDPSRRLLAMLKDSHVRVTELSEEVRARILFNHVNLSVTQQIARRELSRGDWWKEAANHPNYSPRIVEQVIQQYATNHADGLVLALFDALENPLEIWSASFRALPGFDQQMLLTLAVMDSKGAAWGDLERRLHHVPSLDSNLDSAVERLRGSWIESEFSEGRYFLAIADPSQRDYLVQRLASAPAAMKSIIRGTTRFDELSSICLQGQALELNDQDRLFSMGEDIYRDVLDLCSDPLLERLRSLWEEDAGERMERLNDGVGPALAIGLFEMLSQVLHVHADRHRTLQGEIDGVARWFDRAHSDVLAAYEMVEIIDFQELCEAISETRACQQTWLGHASGTSYFANIDGMLQQMCEILWSHRAPYFTFIDSLADADEVVDNVLQYADLLAELGLEINVDSVAGGYVERALLNYCEDEDEARELRESLESIEEVFARSFGNVRRKLTALDDLTEEAAASDARFSQGPRDFESHIIRSDDEPRRDMTSVRALFQSLGNLDGIAKSSGASDAVSSDEERDSE